MISTGDFPSIYLFRTYRYVVKNVFNDSSIPCLLIFVKRLLLKMSMKIFASIENNMMLIESVILFASQKSWNAWLVNCVPLSDTCFMVISDTCFMVIVIWYVFMVSNRKHVSLINLIVCDAVIVFIRYYYTFFQH